MHKKMRFVLNMSALVPAPDVRSKSLSSFAADLKGVNVCTEIQDKTTDGDFENSCAYTARGLHANKFPAVLLFPSKDMKVTQICRPKKVF